MAKNLNRHLIEISPSRENIRLIYLDNSEPTVEIQTRLFEINSAVQFYTNIQLCIDFIKSIVNEEIFLIISNILSTDILDSIDSIRSIIAIFIYDTNVQINELKTKYPKIIDSYTNPNDLLKSIEEKIQFIEKHTFVYTIFDQRQKFIEDLSKESASFLWHQMLINILKQIPQNDSIRDEILNKYSNYYQTYTREQVIQWYTNQSSLYKLINHALRTEDIEILYSFRFVLIDLCNEIEKEYKTIQNQDYLIVYRAGIMSHEEIEKIKQNIGCLISINDFLSTSHDKNISLSFLKNNFTKNENILLEIHIDLSMETINISMICEKEILLNINSLFRIDSMEFDSINNLWGIKMIATNDGIKQVDEYLKCMMEKEIDYQNPMIYFGYILWNKLGRMNQAKDYFEILLKSFPNDYTDISRIYMELGNIYGEMGEYSLALNNYHYALAIYQKEIPKDYIHSAVALNHIGVVYKQMGNLNRAIDYYRQSLDVYETKCSKDEIHLQRANTIENLGLVYKDKNDFDTALTYFTLVYNVRCDNLPNDHPLLAKSLSNIGNIYHDKNELNQALNYYQQALSIQEKSYPNDHLDKANTTRNIGSIYGDNNDCLNALTYFNRALEMRQRLLLNPTHPDIAICYGDIGNIYEKMNNLDSALDCYQQQFQIEEQCLSFNHPNLITHFDWIINILKKKNESENAIELCQKKLFILKTFLRNAYENHPRVARILVLIATIYEDENPKQADQHYQQALSILEKNQNEEIFQKCLLTMRNFYWKCRIFDRALICQMKLLNHRRSMLSSNHKDIAYTLRDLARLYRTMDKSNEALEYFNQSLNILQTNYGSEHVDVKNIQKEISHVNDVIKSISSSANEDYEHRRSSNVHQQLLNMSQDDFKSRSSIENYKTGDKPSKSTSKSSACILL